MVRPSFHPALLVSGTSDCSQDLIVVLSIDMSIIDCSQQWVLVLNAGHVVRGAFDAPLNNLLARNVTTEHLSALDMDPRNL